MSILSPALFSFLGDLAENNDRDWFQSNKARYEADVLEPCLAFVAAMEEPLREISPRFLAVAKRQGGSLFRIHRDTRFSKDKTPYKTNVGLQFRHESASRDVHAPGFYLHIARGDVGVGCGMWHPDARALGRVRDRVVGDADGWAKVKEGLERAGLSFMGESLKRAPRGYDADHVHVEDLKRKDWAVHRKLDEAAITADDAVERVAAEFARSGPFVRWLCETQDLPFS